MDHRTELKAGTALAFPGMACIIERCIGRGANAIVYEGGYQDATSTRQRHRVLIKELFPYDVQGHIWRNDEQAVCTDAQGEALWRLHRLSFERGNDIHLQLLAQQPDQIGGNWNTFPLHQTLYTILDYSGGRSLDKELTGGTPQELRKIIARMRQLLHALNAFHSRNFLHLDISTDNVLLVGRGEEERVLLIDYNSVHTCEELRQDDGVYFSAKEGFTAPEVRTGMTSAIAPCTDLFSVTAVFYACLTGRPPTAMQLNRKNPPDASESPLLSGTPSTVKAQVCKIMRRGLCVLPDRRYQSCAEMLRDLQELQDRLDGVGVTRAALWEAGRKSVQRLIQQNPSLSYVHKREALYPLRIQPEGGDSMPAEQFMEAVAGGAGASAVLVGEGGMGKSTALLRAVLDAPGRYTPASTAIIYLPLFGWKHGESNYILDHILMELRFDARTKTMDDARHALTALLSHPPRQGNGGRAALLLLLDGLNEAIGDPSELVEEINRLAALPGLRMLVASRTAPENLRMSRASMIRLTEQDVGEALARHGLLLPESAEMRQLLQVPMMLSLFIQTANHTGSQVLCRTEAELLNGYLGALCAKAARDASQPVNYQAEAAVRLVLPAIAGEMRRRGHPLDDQALYKAVSRCYGVFGSKALSRAFPEWIGHSREIVGGQTASAEAWYGQVVQNVLWRQLGLLVRDESGCYHILHQILQDYLIGIAVENDRRLRSQRARMGAAAAVAAVLLIGMAMLIYEVWLKPKPYDGTMSAMAMDAATMQYVNCGLQYEAMTAMLHGSAEPERCAAQVAIWGAPASNSAQLAMAAMQESGGEVVPWSNQPFDFENAAVLLALPEARATAYAGYIRAYQLVQAGETGTSADDFADALAQLLEADADVAWLLDQAVCMPHVGGMSEQQRLAYNTGLLSLPAAQETRSVDTSRGLSYALEKAYERQREAQRTLGQMAVMYDPYVKDEEK